MATNAQRTQAICDALINRTATQEQQLELAEAIYSNPPRYPPFNELTNAQKAAIIPHYLLDHCKWLIRGLRTSKLPAIVDPDTDYNETL